MMAILTDLDLPDLDAATDEESWDYLCRTAIKFADAVKKEVQRGRTPEQIRERFTRRSYGLRPEMAARLEQAARHLKREAI
jgi:hypothetical protein